MEKITEFKNIITDPYAYCRKYKEETGKKIVGYTCSYTPEEIIYAAGALPFRLFGTNEGIHLADAQPAIILLLSGSGHNGRGAFRKAGFPGWSRFPAYVRLLPAAL